MKKLIRAGAVAAASLLASNATALEVDTPAPDFTAQSTQGEIVLSQIVLKGPVILAYYPADFTPG
jgi:peroxiredoxin